MNPFRRPQLKFIAPEFLKTPLKRKIKLAWNLSNQRGNRHWLIIIYSFVIILLMFENSWITGLISIPIIIICNVVILFWFWLSFINEAKQRNKRAILTNSPLLLQPWRCNYKCSSCGGVFNSNRN